MDTNQELGVSLRIIIKNFLYKGCIEIQSVVLNIALC